MQLADLLRENVEMDDKDVWENERTPTPVRCFAVRLHSVWLSVREVEGVLAWLGVGRCYQAVWNWKEKLSGQLNYTDRNHIEKWVQTVTMRIDRFHSFWRGSHSSAKRWLRRFRHYYNRHRPNQASDGCTPVEEALN
jgi:transposase-like protein